MFDHLKESGILLVVQRRQRDIIVSCSSKEDTLSIAHAILYQAFP